MGGRSAICVTLCVCVCSCEWVCVCLHCKRKMTRAINTKLGTHVRCGSGSACIDPEVKKSKVKVTQLWNCQGCVPAVAVVLLLPAWDCTSYDCLGFYFWELLKFWLRVYDCKLLLQRCKRCLRQIMMPAPTTQFFYRLDVLTAAQPSMPLALVALMIEANDWNG